MFTHRTISEQINTRHRYRKAVVTRMMMEAQERSALEELQTTTMTVDK
jgi:hypothetical protein